jgi:hypothetical protein
LTSGYIAYGNSGGTGLTGSSGLTYDTTNGISVSKITFPAVKIASGNNSNTLDDYEIGSWDPTLIAFYGDSVSASYGGREGRYQKIGSWIHFNILMYWSGLSYTGSNGGGPYISIPITSVGYSGAMTDTQLIISYAYGFPTSTGQVLYASAYAGNNIPGYSYGIRIGYIPASNTTYGNNYLYGGSQFPSSGGVNISGFYAGAV